LAALVAMAVTEPLVVREGEVATAVVLVVVEAATEAVDAGAA